jgi:hypothetical protein
MVHVEVQEPTSAGKRGPELRDTLQHWSSSQQGGKAWDRGTRGSARTHLGREARSGAAGHVAALEPTSAVR